MGENIALLRFRRSMRFFFKPLHNFLNMEGDATPTPGLFPGKSHGQRSLVGCRPWGREESDMTEQLHFDFHALEKEMAIHSSTRAWRIPWTEEHGGLQFMGS